MANAIVNGNLVARHAEGKACGRARAQASISRVVADTAVVWADSALEKAADSRHSASATVRDLPVSRVSLMAAVSCGLGCPLVKLPDPSSVEADCAPCI